MLVRPAAEESYRKGLSALEEGRRREALALFEAALEIERQAGAEGAQARYLSYYGLCLALECGKYGEAARACQDAAAAEFFNPELHLNLGRVLLAANRRREAHAALLRGLRWQKGHPAILRELRTMGKRRRPPLPFLHRSHPINVFLGRLSHAPRPAARPA
jgi:tetratricopeptide (TPR) repeat protein